MCRIPEKAPQGGAVLPSRTVPEFSVNENGTTTVTIPITRYVNGNETVYADTHMHSGQPNVNFAKSAGIVIGSGRIALLTFDLLYAALRGKSIKEAYVRLVKKNYSAPETEASLQRTYDDWMETLEALMNVTYNNSFHHLVEECPYEVISTANVKGGAGKEIKFDVTSAFEKELKSLRKVSFAISNSSNGADVETGESATIKGNSPCLVVTYL